MWNRNLAVGWVSCHWVVWFFFCTKDLKQLSLFTLFCIWEMRWVERKKKRTWHFDPFPTFLLWELSGPDWKMSVCVRSREPQLQPHCPGSDLCSDKLEHIILSKYVILLLTVILELVSLVEPCVMWHRVYPEWLWERATHSVISLLSHSKKSVTWPVLLFGFFANVL